LGNRLIIDLLQEEIDPRSLPMSENELTTVESRLLTHFTPIPIPHDPSKVKRILAFVLMLIVWAPILYLGWNLWWGQ
jgi:hypothetical protein